MQYTIHETYEYLVEADSLDEALEAHDGNSMEDGDADSIMLFPSHRTTRQCSTMTGRKSNG
jgi:hypothetical protein